MESYELQYSEDPAEITVTAVLRHDKARERVTSRFLVDTGAQVSMISEFTATDMKIKNSYLEYNEKMAGVKGDEFNVAPLYNTEIYLKGKDDIYRTSHKFLVNPNTRENILGMDFLNKHGLSLKIENNPEKVAEIIDKNAD